MFDVKAARFCSGNYGLGALRRCLFAACDRIEALERENKAMLALVEAARSLDETLGIQHWGYGKSEPYCAEHLALREALAAIPVTAKDGEGKDRATEINDALWRIVDAARRIDVEKDCLVPSSLFEGIEALDKLTGHFGEGGKPRRPTPPR